MGSLTSAIRLAAGPPFSVHRSSPDLVNAPTQAADAAVGHVDVGAGRAAKAQVTTFRTGIGEVEETAPVPRSRGKLVAALVAVAALGGGAFFLLGGSKPAPVAAAKPAVVQPAPAPVAPAPAPVAAKPAAPAKVTVRLTSEPVGANVFDAQGGTLLGTTPVALTRTRGPGFKVRLEKDGFISALRVVPLDEDQSLEFALEHKPAAAPKPAHRAHKAAPADDGPAKL
jgi:hypothetical protein